MLNGNTNSFAFYDRNNGLDFATTQQMVSFDKAGKIVMLRQQVNASKATDDSLPEYGKAYMQSVYNAYLKY